MPAKFVLHWNQDKITERVRAVAEERLRRSGQEVVEAMKSELSGPSPSPPGSPPGRRTGALQRSIKGRVTRPSKDKIRLIVLGRRYAIPLEHARAAKRRRPFIQTGLEYAKGSLKRWFGLR